MQMQHYITIFCLWSQNTNHLPRVITVRVTHAYPGQWCSFEDIALWFSKQGPGQLVTSLVYGRRAG